MNEVDADLLRSAAKAAGIESRVETNGTTLLSGIGTRLRVGSWNPFENTDEALHLAAVLNLGVTFGNGSICVQKANYEYVEETSNGLNAALRRSIVRVAAHVGSLLR